MSELDFGEAVKALGIDYDASLDGYVEWENERLEIIELNHRLARARQEIETLRARLEGKDKNIKRFDEKLKLLEKKAKAEASRRKEIGEAYVRNSRILRSIVSHSPDGIAILDSYGRVILWNGAMEGLTGITRKDVLNTPIWEVESKLSVRDAPLSKLQELYKSKVRQLLKNPNSCVWNKTVEKKIRRENGETLIVQAVYLPIITAGGLQIAVTIRNVTEKAWLEEERDYYKERIVKMLRNPRHRKRRLAAANFE